MSVVVLRFKSTGSEAKNKACKVLRIVLFAEVPQ